MEKLVIAHGLWMPGTEMRLLSHRLRRAGFAPSVYRYATVRDSLSENVHRFAAYLAGFESELVHVVGYSLGGVLAVATAQAQASDRHGRIVCLGAPLNGTAAGRALGRSRLGAWLAGRGIAELNECGGLRPWSGRRDAGCIAGSAGIGVGRLVASFDGPNDGTVAVAETRLAGLTDHIVLPVTHTTMLFDADVARQTVAFLRDGAFEHGPAVG